jgi:hypothetical protein
MLKINFIQQVYMANLIAMSLFITASTGKSLCLSTAFIAKHNATIITAATTLASPHVQHSKSENMGCNSLNNQPSNQPS